MAILILYMSILKSLQAMRTYIQEILLKLQEKLFYLSLYKREVFQTDIFGDTFFSKLVSKGSNGREENNNMILLDLFRLVKIS